MKIDDTLDVFGIHGLAGAFGAIMTGVFANPMINEGNAGLLYGNPGQVWIQIQSVLVVTLYSAIATFIIYKVISFFVSNYPIHFFLICHLTN